MSSSPLKPLLGSAPAHAPLRVSVLEALREAILEGQFAPGEPLVESHLAGQLGVSRTPVREALRALEREGVITALPGRRLIVAKPSEQEIHHLYDIRMALEGLAVRSAASRVTPADAIELRAMVAEMRDALARRQIDRLGAAGRRFHDALVRLSRNEILVAMLQGVAARTHYLRQLGLRDPVLAAETTEDHAELCEAVIAGDSARAERVSQRHIERGRQSLLRQLRGTARPASEMGEPPPGEVGDGGLAERPSGAS